MLQLQEAGENLIQGAVAANGNNQIIVAALGGGNLRSLSVKGGCANMKEIPGLRENSRSIKQGAARLVFSCPGIDDEQKLLPFHGNDTS